MPLSPMQHEEDPADVIFKAVGMKKGVLPGFTVYGRRVLLGTYKRPEKTAGGVFITQQTQDEERNQGKPCLVLALGPTAFVSDANYDFAGQKVEVGDWVSIWVYEVRPVIVNGYPCRLADDTQIMLKIPGPDSVY